MDTCLLVVLIWIILIAVMSVLIIAIGRRPKPLCVVPSREVNSLKLEALNKLKGRNYIVNEKPNGDIYVQKDTFSATTLVFKQNGPNVDVLFIHSNSPVMLAVFIVTIILIWIVALVLAIIADTNSKSFRETEIIPLFMDDTRGAMCPGCKQSIPIDAQLCPYCGRKLK